MLAFCLLHASPPPPPTVIIPLQPPRELSGSGRRRSSNMSKKALQIVFVVILAVVAPPMMEGINVKLDNTATDTTMVPGGPSENQLKCGGCPCNNPCYTTSPPPPPPSPPPPPKMPSPTPGLNCPPPPTTGGGYGLAPPSYIYITGPPGNVYPVNPYFSAGHRNFWVAPPLQVIVFGLVSVLSF
ncbi:sulfated surface glycoprotein 185-like [Cynara cardunculus var. scolymus]|uniref:Uncharacterized protein n=1 Tax=Cynara cardunculus var. scolymus TaxID=59895 RepID=A0A118JY88_CYNCS|nr:sulfated surface glycoprotein 185-like [Cynara cardunculus var. scolymus]KVH97661.1 hypothetical protein Ccrd_000245 [Cynara cardunculus var. scolymus]